MTNENYAAQVAAEVRAQLARAGKDTGDLAEILRVSRPTASLRWSGDKPYSLDEIYAVAKALGVNVAELVLPRVPTATSAA